MLGAAGVAPDLHGSALVALDKLDKIAADGVAKELTERGIDADVGGRAAADVPGERGGSRSASASRGSSATIRSAAPRWTNLEQIRALAASTSAAGKIKVDVSLARGLSYYTGAIMEINVADLAGSLGGGGRYDNLVGMFLGQNIPACGFSLGLERILVVMGERNMFPASLAMTPADVMIATFDAVERCPTRCAWRPRCAKHGLRVLVYPDADKIGKQIKYADGRGIPLVALLGEDEIKSGTITVKNLAAQTQATYEQSAAGAAILETLRQRG